MRTIEKIIVDTMTLIKEDMEKAEAKRGSVLMSAEIWEIVNKRIDEMKGNKEDSKAGIAEAADRIKRTVSMAVDADRYWEVSQ